MHDNSSQIPVVLVMAGHDPTGGAGIQADIETTAANGCRAVTIITCITTQNTGAFKNTVPVMPGDFQEQIDYLFDDININACKIGLVTNPRISALIKKTFARLNMIPIVIDPVIYAGSGHEINSHHTSISILDDLIPHASVLTPNSIEAREITGHDCLDDSAADLIGRGCKAVLITGTHESTDKVINTLYQPGEKPVVYSWERLPGNYHGSGCTLSSAIAANLARGVELQLAVTNAQEYTWQTLKNRLILGKYQFHPDRFYNQ